MTLNRVALRLFGRQHLEISERKYWLIQDRNCKKYKFTIFMLDGSLQRALQQYPEAIHDCFFLDESAFKVLSTVELRVCISYFCRA